MYVCNNWHCRVGLADNWCVETSGDRTAFDDYYMCYEWVYVYRVTFHSCLLVLLHHDAVTFRFAPYKLNLCVSSFGAKIVVSKMVAFRAKTGNDCAILSVVQKLLYRRRPISDRCSKRLEWGLVVFERTILLFRRGSCTFF